MEAAIVLLVLAVFYAVFMGALARGFRKVVRASERQPPPATLPFVSVVIAARDEAATIAACVASVLANDYPADGFEVIVVDDHSQDATAAQVQAVQQRHPAHTVRLISLDPASAGGHKQAALARGIATARGEWILVTDADCTVGPGWIRAMARFFADDVAFVAGPVRYDLARGKRRGIGRRNRAFSEASAGRYDEKKKHTRPTFFSRLQALEFMGLVAVGAGSIGLGRPTICNGANVAYRRQDYLAYHAAQDASVDPASDELLAQHLAEKQTGSVRFCAAPEALVTTPPATSMRAFWEQRRRWAATGARFKGGGLRTLVVLVYAFYVALLLGLLLLPLGSSLGVAVMLALFLKAGSEHLLLRVACTHFKTRRLLRYHLPGQVLQIPYIVFVSTLGALRPTPWKGRKVPL